MDFIDEDIGFGNEIHFDRSCVCGGRGFTIVGDVAKPCVCWKRDTLLSRIKRAGIPQEYFKSNINMLDEGVFGELYTFEDGKLNEIKLKDYIEHYIGSLYKQRESGRGLLLTGGNGVGKTMIACIIVKCALWYSVVSKKKHPDYNGKFITFKEYY